MGTRGPKVLGKEWIGTQSKI